VQVASASGGAEALSELEAAGDTPYSVVFLDAEMPEMDGIELARVIRSRPEWAAMRLVILSSMNSDIPAPIIRELRIHRVLIKPVSRAHLFRCLNEVLGTTSPAANGAQGQPEAPRPRLSSKVLLAEDDPVNQEIARAFLEHLGYQVDLANDGREAVEAAIHHTYDLVLMDCQMPRLDGFEATAAIRRSELTTSRHLTIIALTAYAMQGDRERCLLAGMDDYLPKPFDIAQLDVVLKRWLPEANEAASSGEAT
jgi:CheY-like chemotaxis protein